MRIGFGSVETYDYRYQRTIISGSFYGKAKIGFGSRLSVDGELNVGHNFHISAASTVICRKNITIGENCLIGWESLITDSDLHPIFNLQKERINIDQAVTIGDHCWIGAKASILKGAFVANNNVFALGSIVTGKHEQENTIIAGNPAKVIKKNIIWQE